MNKGCINCLPELPCTKHQSKIMPMLDTGMDSRVSIYIEYLRLLMRGVLK